MAYLWIRSLEIATSQDTAMRWSAFEVELVSLFGVYRSPWMA